jgi:hypothetical protein
MWEKYLQCAVAATTATASSSVAAAAVEPIWTNILPTNWRFSFYFVELDSHSLSALS